MFGSNLDMGHKRQFFKIVVESSLKATVMEGKYVVSGSQINFNQTCYKLIACLPFSML